MTLAALVAELRAFAADPERPEALRRAAAERLARLAEAHERSIPLVPTADPDRWWGVAEVTEPDAADLPGRCPDPAVGLLARVAVRLCAALVPLARGPRRERPQHGPGLRLDRPRARTRGGRGPSKPPGLDQPRHADRLGVEPDGLRGAVAVDPGEGPRAHGAGPLHPLAHRRPRPRAARHRARLQGRGHRGRPARPAARADGPGRDRRRRRSGRRRPEDLQDAAGGGKVDRARPARRRTRSPCARARCRATARAAVPSWSSCATRSRRPGLPLVQPQAALVDDPDDPGRTWMTGVLESSVRRLVLEDFSPHPNEWCRFCEFRRCARRATRAGRW